MQVCPIIFWGDLGSFRCVGQGQGMCMPGSVALCWKDCEDGGMVCSGCRCGLAIVGHRGVHGKWAGSAVVMVALVSRRRVGQT